jgi:hypothetical protein
MAGVKGLRPLRGARSAPLTPAIREHLFFYRRQQLLPPHIRKEISGNPPHEWIPAATLSATFPEISFGAARAKPGVCDAAM